MKAMEAYQQTAIATQSKGRLIVMLYDGAVKFLKLAIKELEAENYAAKGQYINRAQDIINELNAVLDMEAGGEIAENLRKLYLFMGRHLNQANVKRDPQMIREVIGLLEELNQGWKDGSPDRGIDGLRRYAGMIDQICRSSAERASCRRQTWGR
jgi:flagellar secretion chaperone FliS